MSPGWSSNRDLLQYLSGTYYLLSLSSKFPGKQLSGNARYTIKTS